ncbi:hypothetical protein GIB67_038638 [Kingdonia uniflora]|uniref:O-fucosyltransferase family protein n=1 Tax=Kingdonia uniflora TaxID=39325 RepID=A0A7J7NPM4_9MAGN|nr:hypothetical protein GIB67_038638 [Kingdonia uniflora]
MVSSSSEYKGGFHDIRNSICDVVVIARLLNATLVMPEFQSTTSSKGIRRKKEVPLFIVTYSTSPNYYLRHVLPVLKGHSVVELAVADGGCLQLEHPPLETRKSNLEVVDLVIAMRHTLDWIARNLKMRKGEKGTDMVWLDRHSCGHRNHGDMGTTATSIRDSEESVMQFHFSYRLQGSGRPFIAFDLGMTRDALAYHGCSELL